MRFAPVLAVPLLALLAMALLSAPSVSAESDDYLSFTVDGFQYIVTDGKAEVVYYAPDTVAENLEIPSSVTYEGTDYPVSSISIGAVGVDGVRTVSIPQSVTQIDGGALVSETLESISVNPANTAYSSQDGILYDYDKAVLHTYPRGKTDTGFTVPTSVTVLDDSAFLYNTHIVTVSMPDSLYCINGFAFSGCTSLVNVNSGTDNALPSSLLLVGQYAFSGCKSLQNLQMNESLKVIGERAFENTGLTSVTLPFNVDSIGAGAFSGCTSLKAFESESDIFQVTDGILYEVRNKISTLIAYPAAREGDSFSVPSSVTSIAGNAFESCINLKTVELPSGMKTVPALSFNGCTSLEKAVLPDSVVMIDYLAFCDCPNLKEVSFPSNLNTIENYAFGGAAFEEITLPSSVTYVSMYAFAACPKLKEVTFEGEGELTLSVGAFNECLSLETITFNSTDVSFEELSLDIGTDDRPAEVTVSIPKGLDIPDNAIGEYTTLNIEVQGERPYPYENLIGVAICIAVIFLIVYAVREV